MRATRVTADLVAGSTHLTRPDKQEPAWRVFAVALIALLGLAAVTSALAQAQTFTVLYTFAGYPTDGASPIGGLVIDAAGALYGTTTYGGDANCPGSGIGCGTVFQLDTNGVETVLHNFRGPDGAHPSASLIRDAKGHLYGTTEFGGRLQDCTGSADNTTAGCGVVFKLSGNKETVLHRFCSVGNCTDGAEPWRGLVMDASGALYGTTSSGGSVNGGVVFKLVSGKETVLHSFTGSPDGAFPEAGLIIDANGNLYGTAIGGGELWIFGHGEDVAVRVDDHDSSRMGISPSARSAHHGTPPS